MELLLARASPMNLKLQVFALFVICSFILSLVEKTLIHRKVYFYIKIALESNLLNPIYLSSSTHGYNFYYLNKTQ